MIIMRLCFIVPILISFAFLSIGRVQLRANDLVSFEPDSTDQGSLVHWEWSDPGVDVLGFDRPSIFPPDVELGRAQLPTHDLVSFEPYSADTSGLVDWELSDAGVDAFGLDVFQPDLEQDMTFPVPSSFDSLYSSLPLDSNLLIPDHSGATPVDLDFLGNPSIQKNLDLTASNERLASEAECWTEDAGIVNKRNICPIDRAREDEDDDPGVCPKFRGTIKMTTCCCLNAVEYDPLTYPTFQPCYKCETAYSSIPSMFEYDLPALFVKDVLDPEKLLIMRACRERTCSRVSGHGKHLVLQNMACKHFLHQLR
jgi:hypothetical protein